MAGYEKGNTPWNKGKKLSEEHKEKISKGCKGLVPWNKGKSNKKEVPKVKKVNTTMFKKGHTINALPIGAERYDHGKRLIKVAEPNVWKFKHRYLWEQAYGEIPPKHSIIFLDGNKNNCNLDNLMCISAKVHSIMASRGLYSEDADITKAGVSFAKLIIELKKRKDKK